MTGLGGKDRMDAVAGDILCAKADGSKAVFDAEDYDSIPSSWTPIAVVVVPPSHDVYGTGEGAAVSLNLMDYNNPDNGSAINTTNSKIAYGVNNTYINITEGQYINVYSGSDADDLSNVNYNALVGRLEGWLPADGLQGSYPNPIDTSTSWQSSPWAPSPYNDDGSRYEGYYSLYYPRNNRLSYFNGFENTEELCNKSTTYPNWRTDSVIKNTSYEDHSPAACCCWRYHTVGTNQGDWYLPASGEAGYWVVMGAKINQTLSNLGYSLDINIYPGIIHAYWTSTPGAASEYGTTACIARVYHTYNNANDTTNFSGGGMNPSNRSSQVYVRAFVRF